MIDKKIQLTGSKCERVGGFVGGEGDCLNFTFISDDNVGKRWNWDLGNYDEVLDVNGADFSKLKTFFKDHRASVDSAIGSISNVNVKDGKLLGAVTFGTGENEKNIERKYREGILNDCSVGYIIKEYTVTERDNNIDLVTVTKFDIYEVSAVGIGFDENSGIIRSKSDIDKQLELRLDNLEKFFNGENK